MHSNGLFSVLFAALALQVHGDLIMKTQTYDFNATATDSKGKPIPVEGTLVNLQVVYLSTKGTKRTDEVMFNISASVPKRESNDVNLESSDYVERVPTAEFDSSLPMIPAPPMNKHRMGPPPPYPPQFPIPFPNPQGPPSAHSHSSSGSSGSRSKPQPLPSPLNRSPPQPLPPHVPNASHQFNHSSSSSTSTTTAHPSPKPLNPENSTGHGAGGNAHSRAKRSVGSTGHYSTTAKPTTANAKTYRVQDITIVPDNRSTSVNLSPIAGYPWIRNTTGGDNSTQVYQNAHYLNLLAPITNVNVSSSPYSLSDNGANDLSVSKDSAGGVQHYTTLQNLLLSANQNATNNLRSEIEGFFNDSQDQSSVIRIDDIVNKTLEQILSQEEDMMNSYDEFSTEKEDRLEHGGGSLEYTSEADEETSPKTASTQTASHEPGHQTTTGGGNSGVTTQNPSTAGSGTALISSWMVIFTSMIAIILSIV